MRISDWSSDGCSSDLLERPAADRRVGAAPRPVAAHLGDLALQQPVEGAGEGVAVARFAGLQHGVGGQAGVPDRRQAGLAGDGLFVALGRASGRARGGQYVWISGVAGALKKKKK